MIILAIETSCDDTCVAILQGSDPCKFKTLSNVVASQIEAHKPYGGVYPFLAKREHQKNLAHVMQSALESANLSEGDIDMIAVTNGPGLEPCLWVGVNFAQALAKKLNIPLIPVNHIESHILVNFLSENKIKFPAIALVVSGGHTQLILTKKIGSYEILGETRDDAAGECFDKCAKILGLGYPGGLEIAKLAIEADRHRMSIQLPRPMIHDKNYDFSFSGLKTAVFYHHRKQPKSVQKNKKYIINMATEIQQAIIDVLIKKTMKAAKDFGAKSIILGGGVSANQELRRQFLQTSDVCKIIFPPQNLSTDNALMVAVAGYFNRNKKVAPSKVATIQANANLRIS